MWNEARWFHEERKLGMPCKIHSVSSTTEETSQIIDNLSKSPLYDGKIEGTGPRYCPSIEDKVVKFSHKSSHKIYLEPEEILMNGISSCLRVFHLRYRSTLKQYVGKCRNT